MTDLPDPASKPTHDCDLIKEGGGLTCPAGLPVPRGTVLTRRALRSVAILVVLGLLVTGANLLWTAHEVRSPVLAAAAERGAAAAGRAGRAETVHDPRPADRTETPAGQPAEEP